MQCNFLWCQGLQYYFINNNCHKQLHIHAKLWAFFLKKSCFSLLLNTIVGTKFLENANIVFKVLYCLILFLVWLCLFCLNQITDWACLILSLLHPVLAPRTSTCQANHRIASIHQHTLAYQWQPVLTSLTPQKMDSRNIPDLQMKWTAGNYMRNLPLLNSQTMNVPLLNPPACLLNVI